MRQGQRGPVALLVRPRQGASSRQTTTAPEPSSLRPSHRDPRTASRRRSVPSPRSWRTRHRMRSPGCVPASRPSRPRFLQNVPTGRTVGPGTRAAQSPEVLRQACRGPDAGTRPTDRCLRTFGGCPSGFWPVPFRRRTRPRRQPGSLRCQRGGETRDGPSRSAPEQHQTVTPTDQVRHDQACRSTARSLRRRPDRTTRGPSG